VLGAAGNLCLFIILRATGAVPALTLALFQLLTMSIPDTRRKETGLLHSCAGLVLERLGSGWTFV